MTFGGVTPAAIITSRRAASVSGDGLKFPEAVADGNGERRPPELVVLIPDLNLGSLGGEELHDPGEILVGGAVHGGFAVVVDGIDVGAKLESHMDGLQHFALGSRVLAG